MVRRGRAIRALFCIRLLEKEEKKDESLRGRRWNAGNFTFRWLVLVVGGGAQIDALFLRPVAVLVLTFINQF